MIYGYLLPGQKPLKRFVNTVLQRFIDLLAYGAICLFQATQLFFQLLIFFDSPVKSSFISLSCGSGGSGCGGHGRGGGAGGGCPVITGVSTGQTVHLERRRIRLNANTTSWLLLLNRTYPDYKGEMITTGHLGVHILKLHPGRVEGTFEYFLVSWLIVNSVKVIKLKRFQTHWPVNVREMPRNPGKVI